jgi:hypothetical protein
VEVPKLGLCCPKILDIRIFFKSNMFKTCMENILFFQKDLSNTILHPPIEDHLTFALRGFVVRNQIPNLTFDPSFDHNSCISYLNEKYEGNSRHVDFNTFPMVF